MNPWENTSTHEGGRKLPWDWPPFLTFTNPVEFPFYCSTRSQWPLLLQKKICLSLSHLVTKIIYKNMSVDSFDTFCNKFLFDFHSYWPPFLFLDLFDSSFLQNLRSDWVHLFIVSWTLPTNIFMKYPLHPPPQDEYSCAKLYSIAFVNFPKLIPKIPSQLGTCVNHTIKEV